MQDQSKFVEVKAFTTKFNGIARQLVTPIKLSLPFLPQNSTGAPPSLFETTALWDTGATNSVITEASAKALSLQPVSMTKVSHAGGEGFANVYLINIYLPNMVAIPFVNVTECSDTAGNFGAIIGMDIITLGDFSISNRDRKTTLSFRVPSLENIDYVMRRTDTTHIKKVGRNDTCPCGSGKKFKYCHGRFQ